MEKMILSPGDELWIVRDQHGAVCEAIRLPAAWLTPLPPTAEYPAGLFHVIPPAGTSIAPRILAGGFSLDRRDCLAPVPPKRGGINPNTVLSAYDSGAITMAEARKLIGLDPETGGPLPGHPDPAEKPADTPAATPDPPKRGREFI